MEDLDVRKASGSDGVSSWILKECGKQLAEGKISIDWKRADIVPIYKKECREELLNYNRPVSLTSVDAKICERIIKDRWIKYPEDKNRLIDGHFGYIEVKSCSTNLICFYSRVTDIVQERDGWADGIYLDLRKTFDKMSHKRLL
ncbi:uncharacterized protein LOC135095489 [Scylla paramamosain]|uniref:uncharacterized protein LOC135095489 n=1 Tax=Scylla paramamosain TaxID=85552 RepID=UPI003082CC30